MENLNLNAKIYWIFEYQGIKLIIYKISVIIFNLAVARGPLIRIFSERISKACCR